MLYTLTRAFRVLADSLSRSVPSGAADASGSSASAHQYRALSRIRAAIEPLEFRTMMSTTYYVSPYGSDSNNGTSTSSPWKSTGKVSGAHLGPGDHVLFQGGQTFYGSMNLYNDGGSASSPVVISSYGSGRATINSGKNTGVWVLNSTGLTLDNLKFQGTPGSTSGQDGIRIENYSNTVRSGFTVNNCDISGYAEGGIVFGSDGANQSLNNVVLSNNNVYNNVMAGIRSFAVNAESNTNVMITNNLVHNNYGDGRSVNSGNGIMLQGLNGAVVQYNSAYENGANAAGDVGIWTYSSNNVLVQYNQSYNNHTTSWDDGDGFDFDADTSNSIMQYNLAYGNDGGGFQLNQWWDDNKQTGDIIRYNISQNNGRKNNYSGIDVWGKVLNAQIYNNTVYTTPGVNGTTSAIRISNNIIKNLFADNIKVANNIFVTTGGTPLIDFYSAALIGAKNISFTGNVYYSYSGPIKFVWGSKTYSSLAAFQAGTGQEKLNGVYVGAYENPMLTAPGQASAVSGAFSTSAVWEYNLSSNTPILNVGVALTSANGLANALTSSRSYRTVPGEDQHLIGGVPPSSGGGSTGGGSSGGGTTITPATGTIGNSYLSGADIGNPKKGANSISGSTDAVTGGGTGITGTSDSFRYAYTTLTGNGEIVAQISSVSNNGSSAQAGVMIRNSTGANSAQASLMLSPGNVASLLSRATAGGSTSKTTKSDSGDQWVKMVRVGNVFSAYLSSNGSSWALVGTTNVTMNATIEIGLAASASSLSSTNTAVFKNVSFSGNIS